MGLFEMGSYTPITKDDKLLAQEFSVYAGDDDEYFTFITPEAYLSLESWMNIAADVENTSPKTVGLCEILEHYKTPTEGRERKRSMSG